MIEWLFSFLVIYLLYKLIFDFIIPISKASAHMRSKIQNINEQPKQDSNHQKSSKDNIRSNSHATDYIEFEEIK